MCLLIPPYDDKVHMGTHSLTVHLKAHLSHSFSLILHLFHNLCPEITGIEFFKYPEINVRELFWTNTKKPFENTCAYIHIQVSWNGLLNQ